MSDITALIRSLPKKTQIDAIIKIMYERQITADEAKTIYYKTLKQKQNDNTNR